MKKPIVSIISISYNQEKYIKNALDGFVMQKTDFDFEVIIADDGSQDKTPDIIKEYAAAYSNIFKPVLRKKNIGSLANMIDTLQMATGKYIAICEGDDYWTDPAKLQTQVNFLEKNPSYAGCFHRVKVMYEGKEKADAIFPDVKDPSWYTTDELLKTNYIPTNSILYKRQDYSNLPTNVMPFDWYFHLYHAHFGKIVLIDKVMSVYRKHKGGIWWDYDVDRDKIWKQHGVSFIALFDNVAKLYGKDQKRSKIIEESINQTLDTFIGVDEKYGSDLLKKAFTAFPKRQQPFMAYQHRKLAEKDRELDGMKARLLEVGDERTALAIERDLATHKITEMTNTRTWRLRTKATKVMRKREQN